MNSPSTWQAFASRVDRKLDQGGIKNSVDQLSIPLASSSTPFRSKSRKTAVARSQGWQDWLTPTTDINTSPGIPLLIDRYAAEGRWPVSGRPQCNHLRCRNGRSPPSPSLLLIPSMESSMRPRAKSLPSPSLRSTDPRPAVNRDLRPSPSSPPKRMHFEPDTRYCDRNYASRNYANGYKSWRVDGSWTTL